MINLNYLNLSVNRILNLKVISNLTKLVTLNLGCHFEKKISTTIQKLENFVKIKKGAYSFLNNLPKLTQLHLSGNEISDIFFLRNFIKLQLLNLNDNKILDVSVLNFLKNLEKLYLKNNQLLDISFLQNLPNLRDLDLGKNPFLYKLPPEYQAMDIWGQTKKSGLEILQYWRDTYGKKEKSLPIREAKVVFVGEGGTGKTSLMHLLLHGEKVATSRTDKIEIYTDNQQFSYEGEALTLRFWDFGGQDIMHATHKFFMSERTLYVLVSNGRKNEDETLENWAEMLKSSIGDSPVLLVANHLDKPEDTHRIPDTELKKQFPNLILPVIETSWETGRGIDELRQAIQNTLQTMPHFQEVFSPIYQSIKERLLQVAESYIDYRGFERICQEIAQTQEDVFERTSQSILADILNDLGIMLNFRRLNDKLEDLLIFKPDWIVDGVYKIINSGEAQREKGKVSESTIHELLRNIGYQTSQERGFIIEMMKHFKLAYQKTHLRDCHYLIPSLFDKNRPKDIEKNWQVSSPLRVRFQYDIWRNDYISYFLVSQHDKIQEGNYWINGAILQYDEHPVFIESVRREKSIFIEIAGKQDRRYALWRVREALQDVHNLFDAEKLGIEQWLVYEENGRQEEFSIADLKQALADGESTIYSAKLRRRLNIAELLEVINISQAEELAFLKRELAITAHAPTQFELRKHIEHIEKKRGENY